MPAAPAYRPLREECFRLLCLGIDHDSPGRPRELHKPKWIWIDQICINQQDDAEKNTQISLMGNIYRNAEIVTIWAGSGNAKITWIFQEVLLAKDTRLVCGITVVPHWMDLASMVVKACEEAQSSPMIFRMQELGQRMLKPFDTLGEMRKLQEKGRQDARRYDLELLNLVKQREQIGTVVTKKCSGELGEDVVMVRYRVDTCSKFLAHLGADELENAIDLVPSHGTFLFCSNDQLPPLSSATLPSWVPDLTSPPPMTHTWSKYKAGRLLAKPENVPAPIILDLHNPPLVRLPGICMAIITQAATLPKIQEYVAGLDALDDTGGISLAKIDRLLAGEANIAPQTNDSDASMRRREFVRVLEEAISLFSSGAPFRKEKFVRTLVGGTLYPEVMVQLGFEKEYDVMWGKLERWRGGEGGADGDDGPNSIFLRSMAEAWKGACVFATGREERGIGPAAAKTGDKVCIFFGGSSPVVLRPEKGVDGKLLHKVLGPAYVDELMDGKAFRAKSPGLVYEEFDIV
ncbi:hypothetical protein B0T16DRAFT_393022 [Cercophora newfieldiana]|uniref:Heterokaryon incompatibility domain-containing protein n=1 Tax=Cercophora newfieldiana TaxID=92897 RepID=A0AA40CK98_9PEZI|nr:hypothetical protein B0T16DRAFT_393022 [Cercophora newfieldiana]